MAFLSHQGLAKDSHTGAAAGLRRRRRIVAVATVVLTLAAKPERIDHLPADAEAVKAYIRAFAQA